MSESLRQSTLLFLVEDNKILLAMKKRGFGIGKYNGVGGKPNPKESIDATAVRECEEEIGVSPQALNHVATLDFYFEEDKSDWDQQVIVYLCNKWRGSPKETEEMRPHWFDVGSIPYEDMWPDDIYWLPKVLGGYFVEATFHFDENENIKKHQLITRPI